jgi:hypothetical protein
MAERDLFKLLEPVMVFGVILVILVWQWWSAARAVREDRAKAAREHVRDQQSGAD